MPITQSLSLQPTDSNGGSSGTVMALLKWMHHNGVGDDSLSLSLRTDSQDAWVFQPPLAHEMALKADFFMGLILYFLIVWVHAWKYSKYNYFSIDTQ